MRTSPLYRPAFIALLYFKRLAARRAACGSRSAAMGLRRLSRRSCTPIPSRSPCHRRRRCTARAPTSNVSPPSRCGPVSIDVCNGCEWTQERESSESPMLNAFCRVAPSVRFSFLAIALAGVFLRAMVFSERTSVAVQARRFDFLAIKPPIQERQRIYPLTGTEENTRRSGDHAIAVGSPQTDPRIAAGQLRNGVIRSFLATYAPGRKCKCTGDGRLLIANQKCHFDILTEVGLTG